MGLLALLVIAPIFAWTRRRSFRQPGTWLGLAAIAYLVVLFSLTFFPLPLPPYHLTEDGCVWLRLRPFGTIGPALSHGLAWQDTRYAAGNVLAFVPVGTLLPLLKPNLRRPWLDVAVAGALLSLAIELGQLVVALVIGFPYRQADIDDVLLNTLGALTGYALLRPMAPARRLE